jgi:hypothetical protein
LALACLGEAPFPWSANAAGELFTFNDSATIPPGWNFILETPATAPWDGSQNAGPPAGGSMCVQGDWIPETSPYQWQDSKICFALPHPGIDSTP